MLVKPTQQFPGGSRKMPLDTSSYSLALLRLDGRRWNELRRINAQISTQAAADGSSYIEVGNTKVLCTVAGPAEGRRTGAARDQSEAAIEVNISIAGFSQVERKKRSRTDKCVVYLPKSRRETNTHQTDPRTAAHNIDSICLHPLDKPLPALHNHHQPARPRRRWSLACHPDQRLHPRSNRCRHPHD